MKVKIVNAGRGLRAVDKKGRTIADIPVSFSSTEAKRLLEAHGAVVPCPPDPEGRVRWAAAALGIQ